MHGFFSNVIFFLVSKLCSSEACRLVAFDDGLKKVVEAVVEKKKRVRGRVRYKRTCQVEDGGSVGWARLRCKRDEDWTRPLEKFFRFCCLIFASYYQNH